MKDPSVRAAYMLEAQVNAYNFGKENAEQYVEENKQKLHGQNRLLKNMVMKKLKSL